MFGGKKGLDSPLLYSLKGALPPNKPAAGHKRWPSAVRNDARVPGMPSEWAGLSCALL